MTRGVSRRAVLKGASGSAAATALTGVGLGAGGGRAAAAPLAAGASVGGGVAAMSPDGRVTVRLDYNPAGVTWAVSYDGQPVLDPSELGLALASGGVLGPGAKMNGVQRATSTGSWRPLFGQQVELSNACEEVRLDLADPASGIAFSVVGRAYDEGAALRYVLTSAPGGSVTLAGERTGFAFPDGSMAWTDVSESDWILLRPGDIPVTSSGADSGPLSDQPMTVSVAGGQLSACVCESARTGYPRLMLSAVSGQPTSLVSHLMTGLAPGEPTFSVQAPFSTPWRVLVLGATPPDLINHAGLVTTLADPGVVADTSWIKPGKVIREVTLTTAGGLACVDFAAAHNLQYVEFDDHWYGSVESNPTAPIPALDLAQVIAYGKSKGVGVLLYVDHSALYQIDNLVQLYQSWGASGVKIGFVNEGSQSENEAFYDVVYKCGQHQLIVDSHDDLRPWGQERTLPHWLTMEGVRGNEHFPSATHNVTLPFTRNIGGPMDYTICYNQSRDRTTNAHQLAMAAVFYSPLEWLYWYSRPSDLASGFPELSWFDKIPSTWDETRALAGQIGEYVVIARRAAGTWYLGAMTNERSRILNVPLDFLGPGSWQAYSYADGSLPDIPQQTRVVLKQQTVTSGTTMSLNLAPAGGQAIRFEQ